MRVINRWSSAASFALLLATAGCGTRGGIDRVGTQAAPTPASTCASALVAVQDALAVITATDAGGLPDSLATTRLAADRLRLQSLANNVTDSVLSERLQDVTDAISAYAAGVGDRGGARYLDLRAQARGALNGFVPHCT